MGKTDKSRRSFVKKLTGTAIATGTSPLWLFGKDFKSIPIPFKEEMPVVKSPSDNIRFACIGMGIQGFGNCRGALSVEGTELVAVADLYDGRLTRTKEFFGVDVDTTRDYKEILDRDDIDAVIIATTDHWHDHIAIEACEKGKAVYCEKPMVHHIEEGHKVIAAQQKANNVFQVGSQRVSSIIYHKAKELYEEGAIGQLVLAETWYDRYSAIGAWQYSIPPNVSTKDIDWETYLGDAPKVPFDPVRFFRWRNYQDYGTGVAGDLFVHLFSGLHLILGSNGPDRVYASGGLRYWKDGRDVPDVLTGVYDYPQTDTHPAFNLQMRVNFIDGSGGGQIIRLVGSEGEMVIGGNKVTVRNRRLPEAPGYGGWDSFVTFPEEVQKEFEAWYKEKYPRKIPDMKKPEEAVYEAPDGYSDHYHHHLNFYKAIRNETKVVEDAVFGMRAAGAALASNKSYFEKRIINWDADKMKVV